MSNIKEIEHMAKELKDKIWSYMGEVKVKHEPLQSAMSDLIAELEEYQMIIEDSA
jgi:U3 small nucleolar ribonucleoprotein component